MRKLKTLIFLLANYAMLIGVIIGLRLLHGMEISVVYFVVISSVMVVMLVGFIFLEPQHLSKVLPKNSKASLILTLILRFVPLTKRRILNIKHAQEMRGAKFGKFSQFKNYLCLFIPSIVSIIKWSDILAENIQLRGGK